MTNSKATKRALFSSFVSLLLCFTMLMGATFAWFTDNVSSTGNRIQAGTLEVDLVMDKTKNDNYVSIAEPENDQARGDIFSEATGNGINWEPGKTEIVYLGVRNNGSLALKYNILLEVIDGGLIGSLEYAILDGVKAADLKGVEDWATIKAQAEVKDVEAGQFVAAPNGVLDEIVKDVDKETDYFALAVHMKEDAGNEYQGDSITIDVKVVATQKDAEEDSFDDQYDVDAKYDGEVGTAEEFLAAVAGGDIKLTDSIVYHNTDPDKQMILEATAAINFDGNGNTITMTGADPSIGNHGYVAFIPPAGEDVTVSDLTVTGTGFVELGHYGIGDGEYVANNLVLKDMVSTLANGDKGYTLGCTFCHYGTATLNNCTMTGAKALIDGAIPVDAGFVNYTTTTVNGGKYGTIYCWSHSDVTINDAEVDYIYAAPIKGVLNIGSGTHVGTININSTSTNVKFDKIILEDGATVETVIYDGVTYTWAEWLAR